MTDEPVPTLRQRMRSAGISDEAIDQHHAAHAIRLNGQPVDDLDQPAPKPATWTIGPA